MNYYVGIDLHSTNTYVGVIDQDNRKVFSKKFHNKLDTIIQALELFRSTAAGLVVEATYNWWMGCRRRDIEYILPTPQPSNSAKG